MNYNLAQSHPHMLLVVESLDLISSFYKKNKKIHSEKYLDTKLTIKVPSIRRAYRQ